MDGPYLITLPSVNDKAAFHSHWVELCEIPCTVSTTKLGGLKPGELGCSMATNEHQPRESGILRIVDSLEDLPSPVRKSRPNRTKSALEGCRAKHPDQIEGLLKYLWRTATPPLCVELTFEREHQSEGVSRKHIYSLIAPSHRPDQPVR